MVKTYHVQSCLLCFICFYKIAFSWQCMERHHISPSFTINVMLEEYMLGQLFSTSAQLYIYMKGGLSKSCIINSGSYAADTAAHVRVDTGPSL